MTILGIDYGEKRVGLALSMRDTVAPLTTLDNTNETHTIQTIVRYGIENKAEKFVVGLPLTADNKETPMAKIIKRFGKKIKIYSKKPVEYQNELSTSETALDYAIDLGVSQKRRKKNDALAAELILRNYITDHS